MAAPSSSTSPISDHLLAERLSFTRSLAALAAEKLVASWQSSTVSVSVKSDQSLVTSADLEIEQLIINKISKFYSGELIISEEAASKLRPDQTNDKMWIIDPIDGTTNFAHGHVHSAVSIAYAEGGKMQLGVVNAPLLAQEFYGSRGKGAFLNDNKISVSGLTDLQRALVATGFPNKKTDLDLLIRRVRTVLDNCHDLRRIGAATLDICWVACGKLDAFYESVKLWDFAAAALIAEEAGARVGHLNPPPDGLPAEFCGDEILIATPALFDQLKKLLKYK